MSRHENRVAIFLPASISVAQLSPLVVTFRAIRPQPQLFVVDCQKSSGCENSFEVKEWCEKNRFVYLSREQFNDSWWRYLWALRRLDFSSGIIPVVPSTYAYPQFYRKSSWLALSVCQRTIYLYNLETRTPARLTRRQTYTFFLLPEYLAIVLALLLFPLTWILLLIFTASYCSRTLSHNLLEEG